VQIFLLKSLTTKVSRFDYNLNYATRQLMQLATMSSLEWVHW